MPSKKELDQLFQELGITPLKKLGQNFLVNDSICQSILKEALSSEAASIVEIGPGLGALTHTLLKSSAKVSLIELDGTLAGHWQEKVSAPHEVFHCDALKFDWTQVPPHSVLVSNLPYSIAASLVIDLSVMNPCPFDKLVLMFQKEVAQRMMAPSKSPDYGIPSVLAQSAWEISKLIDAGPQDFHPVPNVGSRVLTFLRKPMVGDQKSLLKVVKAAFSHRRKKLKSNLKQLAPGEKVVQVFEEMGLEEGVRPEVLTVDQYNQLALKIL